MGSTLSSLSCEKVSSMIPKTRFNPMVVMMIKNDRSNISRKMWYPVENTGTSDSDAVYNGITYESRKSIQRITQSKGLNQQISYQP